MSFILVIYYSEGRQHDFLFAQTSTPTTQKRRLGLRIFLNLMERKIVSLEEIKNTKEMNFSDLQPADYLFLSSGLLIEDQQNVLSIHNRMVKIVKQFSNIKHNSWYGEMDTLKNIFTCKLFWRK